GQQLMGLCRGRPGRAIDRPRADLQRAHRVLLRHRLRWPLDRGQRAPRGVSIVAAGRLLHAAHGSAVEGFRTGDAAHRHDRSGRRALLAPRAGAAGHLDFAHFAAVPLGLVREPALVEQRLQPLPIELVMKRFYVITTLALVGFYALADASGWEFATP